MQNSQTNKPPITLSINKHKFWLLIASIVILLACLLFLMYGFILPQALQSSSEKLKIENVSLVKENSILKNRNDELLIENGRIQQNLESELTKVAELQAQANIVEKIKQESLEEIEKYSTKLSEQKEKLDFYQELMSPSVDQELQCFNINAKYSNKYVDYGVNLVLDENMEGTHSYNVEFRLLTGKDNVELTSSLPEDLAPDTIRDITIQNSIRLTGKIKHNNKLGALKVLDIRVFNKSNKLSAQCWKVF